MVDFLSLRLGDDVHAIRMAEIAGLFTDVKTTSCPTSIAELRGIAGLRGALTPVYDLAMLLGYPMSSGHWIVLAKGRTPALAFDVFEEHFRIESTSVAAQAGSSSPYVREVARLRDRAWPVIDITSVVAAIKARTASASSYREH
jgi:purine-binding chemotaxis protein CheW